MKKLLLLMLIILMPSLAYGEGKTIILQSGGPNWSGLLTNVIPGVDDAYDIGSSTKAWKDLYVDGVGYIDTLSTAASALPSISWKDSNDEAASPGDTAQFYWNLTDTGDGTQDASGWIRGYVGGSLETWMLFDGGNATLELGTTSLDTNVKGNLEVDQVYVMSSVDVACNDDGDTCAYTSTTTWHRITSGSDAANDTMTITAGSVDGEIHTFTLVSDGGDDVTLDVSTGSDQTLADAGDSVDYMWDATNSTWWVK